MNRNKIFVAAAVAGGALLTCGASIAQSSLTFSGVLDVGFEKTAAGQPLKLASGRSTNSFYRISGTEDLGGGLKANLFLQHIFQADTGFAGTNQAFNDGSWVGLSGSMGSVTLGRSMNPLFRQSLGFVANGTKGVTGYAQLGDAVINDGTLSSNGVQVNNQITYSSPDISGFAAQIGYAPGEANGAKHHRAVALTYKKGPFSMGVGHGTRPKSLTSTTTDTMPENMTQIGVAYDFGVARVSLLAQKDRNFPDSQGYALGVVAAVAGGTVWGSYDVRQLAGNATGHVFQLGYKYPLSKRTHLYAQLGTKDKSWSAATNAITMNDRSTGYGLGVNHQF